MPGTSALGFTQRCHCISRVCPIPSILTLSSLGVQPGMVPEQKAVLGPLLPQFFSEHSHLLPLYIYLLMLHSGSIFWMVGSSV